MQRACYCFVMFWALGCDWFSLSEKISGSDCKPHKLSKVDSCAGEDRSFQECYFYYRATGVPDRAWCEAMPSPAPTGGQLTRCTWDSPLGWTAVACSAYNIQGPARCFACTSGGHEAALTYVYAYDASCKRGLEQVTCNADATQAGIKLGVARF